MESVAGNRQGGARKTPVQAVGMMSVKRAGHDNFGKAAPAGHGTNIQIIRGFDAVEKDQ
jgi:hypothetical protein